MWIKQMDFIQLNFTKNKIKINFKGVFLLKNIRDLNLAEIEEDLLNMGEKKYRAKQIYAWLYRGVEYNS